MQFDEVLRRFAEFFDGAGIRWAVIGDVGLAAWGFEVREIRLRFLVEPHDRERVVAFVSMPQRFDVELVLGPMPDTVPRTVAGVTVRLPTLEVSVAWTVAIDNIPWLPIALKGLGTFDVIAFDKAFAAVSQASLRIERFPAQRLTDNELWDAVTLLNGPRRVPYGAAPFEL
jgi:hypothetical protein